MEICPEKVGQRLRQCAESRGLSQTEVCRLTGFATGTMSRYFNGASLPKSQELLELAKFFEVSMEWLLTGESRDPGVLRVREDAVAYDVQKRRTLETAAKELEEIVKTLREMDC